MYDWWTLIAEILSVLTGGGGVKTRDYMYMYIILQYTV